MVDPNRFFDEIDVARLQRLRELTEIERIFTNLSGLDPLSIRSKAVVVLSYATWEGFYNECIAIYIRFLQECSLRIVDVGWLLLVGSLSPEFNTLRDQNHSAKAKTTFVAKLRDKLDATFDNFDRNVVSSKSNLNYARLSDGLTLLNCSSLPFQQERLKLDRELVGWRHAVAHGSAPDLTILNVSEHVKFTSNLMLLLSDTFQSAIMSRVST